MKPVGKPDAGNPHVRFDERGWETGRRSGVSARAHPRLYKSARHLLEPALMRIAPADEFEIFVRLDVNEAETGDRQHAPDAVLLDVPRRLTFEGRDELHATSFAVVENVIICLNLDA